jgi:hypothetical protein
MSSGTQIGVIVVGENINEKAYIEWVKKDSPKYEAGTPFVNSNGEKCIPINKIS